MRRLGIPPLLLRAGLNYLRRHPWQAMLALIGISMGVAVVLAVDLANSAARASFELSAAQLRGAATHRIVGNQSSVDQALYVQWFNLPLHPPMAPVVESKVRLKGRSENFQLLGLDLFAEGQFGRQLSAAVLSPAALTDWLTDPSAVSISQSAAIEYQLKVGDRIVVEAYGKQYPLKIINLFAEDALTSKNLLVVDIATAQAIKGWQGQLSHIDLILDSFSEQWVKHRLIPGVKLISIEEQTQGIVGLSAAFELNLTAMSLLALLVGIFLIYNAMSFSIVQRRSLFGRLRSLGVYQRELYRVIFAEAMILAIVGTLFGIVLGIWLGQGLTQIVAATVSELYYDVSAGAMRVEIWSLIKAISLGIIGTVLATWIPAYQASRVPPLTTLSRTALETSSQHYLPRLALAGCALVIAGLVVAFLLPGGLVMGFIGLFILLFGAVLMTPMSLPLAHHFLRRFPLGGIWRMAIRDIDRHISRLATAAAALMVALAASVGVALMVDSMRSSVSGWLEELLNADLYIAAEGFQENAFLPSRVVQQAPLLENVVASSLYRDNELLINNRPVRLVAAQLSQPSREGFDLVDYAPKPWHQYEQGELLVSEPLAYRLQLSPGDDFVLPTPRGDVAFRIAAIFRDYASEHGRIFMNLARYRDLWQDEHIDTLALFDATADSQALKQRVQQSYGVDHALVVTEARLIFDESLAIFDRTFRITEVLRLLSVLVAFIGILSALMAVQLERRKEFAVLRALGLTRWQVSVLIINESLILGLMAALMALPTGLIMAWVLTNAIQLRAFGWTMPFVLSAAPLFWTLLLGVSAAFLASIYPAWIASQSNPAPQLRED